VAGNFAAKLRTREEVNMAGLWMVVVFYAAIFVAALIVASLAPDGKSKP
jgi:hypothetical protein